MQLRQHGGRRRLRQTPGSEHKMVKDLAGILSYK